MHFGEVFFAKNQVFKIFLIDLFGSKKGCGAGDPVSGTLQELFRIADRLIRKAVPGFISVCRARVG